MEKSINMYADIRLGVNIDHVATVRNARGVAYPDPITAAALAELAGADGITVHLREDRRHIKDRDVFLLKETLTVPMNLEMALTDEMLKVAEALRPSYVCLVPEKREELTTEGGLDVISNEAKLETAIQHLSSLNIQVSTFIDPSRAQIDVAKKVGSPLIEIHTGEYAEANSVKVRSDALDRVIQAVKHADELGLVVNAGHGLNYNNVADIAGILPIYELNIGHSIVSRAVFEGLKTAVFQMKQLMCDARRNAYMLYAKS